MRKRAILGAAVAASVILAAHGMSAWNTFTFAVIPADFDPFGTHLVEAEWEDGIGCPTNSNTGPFLPPNFNTVGTGTFTDPACVTTSRTSIQGAVESPTDAAAPEIFARPACVTDHA